MGRRREHSSGSYSSYSAQTDSLDLLDLVVCDYKLKLTHENTETTWHEQIILPSPGLNIMNELVLFIIIYFSRLMVFLDLFQTPLPASIT